MNFVHFFFCKSSERRKFEAVVSLRQKIKQRKKNKQKNRRIRLLEKSFPTRHEINPDLGSTHTTKPKRFSTSDELYVQKKIYTVNMNQIKEFLELD